MHEEDIGDDPRHKALRRDQTGSATFFFPHTAVPYLSSRRHKARKTSGGEQTAKRPYQRRPDEYRGQEGVSEQQRRPRAKLARQRHPKHVADSQEQEIELMRA